MKSQSESERLRAEQYNRLHRSPEIRAALIKKLETLLEQYPMLRAGQLLVNAVGMEDRLFNMEDDVLLSDLERLELTYQRFQKAGIRKEQL